MSKAFTKEEFQGWLDHPVTRAVRQMLANKRADLRNEWEMSDPTSYESQTFVLANVANLGWCRGLAFAEALDYESYLTEIENAEPKRAEAPGSGSAD